MKRWSGGVVILFLLGLVVLRYGVLENPLVERTLGNPLANNSSEPLRVLRPGDPPAVQNPVNVSEIVSVDSIVSSLFAVRNLTDEEMRSLYTWNHLKHLANGSDGLPNALEAIREAQTAWESLMVVVEDEKVNLAGNDSAREKSKEKHCPYSIKRMNASEFGSDVFKLVLPCGMVQGSSITIIGTPEGLVGNFRFDLTGTSLPGDPDPPVILHYNVRLLGDKLTEDPVIVQNTWTVANDWGEEERCPCPDCDENKKVDGLEQCSEMVGKEDRLFLGANRLQNASRHSLRVKEGAEARKFFPFKLGYLAIATLRVGVEGIQMTVDGKHITSFPYRESLEPWLISEARISGDINLISVLASGLPTSEDIDHVIDIELLKSSAITLHEKVVLFIGVFSTANNFKRRMAVRRTWMQYEAVRSGAVLVRFFVGLHKNQMVNKELWNEARTYGDIQLMPFVDYYSLITWKTIAICIYGTKVVSADYVMKTDDDAFVRIDEVLSSIKKANTSHGLLYGRINVDSQPHRDPESKWYISPEEWPEEQYPPWAHGPGYVVSHDIAKAVCEKHKEGNLKMFKLEDVSMGIWIDEMRRNGLYIKYVNEERIYTERCEINYVVAHYQEPRNMLCLWQKLQDTHQGMCCSDEL